jgi:hypothetical protein
VKTPRQIIACAKRQHCDWWSFYPVQLVCNKKQDTRINGMKSQRMIQQLFSPELSSVLKSAFYEEHLRPVIQTSSEEKVHAMS